MNVNKSVLVFGAFVLIAVAAVGVYSTKSGLEGRFNDPVSSRRVSESRNSLPVEATNGLSVPALDPKYEQYLLSQPTYVTLADLSTEVVKRRLNITSGWGKTDKSYPPLKQSTPEMKAAIKQDCANGLIDGEFELGEWQYCFLLQDSGFPFSPQMNVDLKAKVKQGDAAKIIAASLLSSKISGVPAGLNILDTFADKNYQPNEYLTVELATVWFKNINKQLGSANLSNPWDFWGDFAPEYSPPKAY